MLAFCPLVSLVSYWTNSQLQTNAASVSIHFPVESARCHTFVTLRPVLWKLTAGGDFKAHIYVFFTESGEWLLNLCIKFLNFPTVFPYVELNSF